MIGGGCRTAAAPTVTYTGRRECMHGVRDDLPANLAEHRAGRRGVGGLGGASVEKIYATCQRAENDDGSTRAFARVRLGERGVVSAICMKFQHRLSLLRRYSYRSRNRNSPAPRRNDIKLRIKRECVRFALQTDSDDRLYGGTWSIFTRLYMRWTKRDKEEKREREREAERRSRDTLALQRNKCCVHSSFSRNRRCVLISYVLT